MNNKIFLSFLIGLMFFVSMVSFTSGQLAGVENQIQGAVDNLEKNITKVKEFGEKDKWDFIGSQWKEFLLKNKAIVGVDVFFTKINVVFVVLFAHDWAISIEMLFVFLLWVFTLISLYGYAGCFSIKSGAIKLFTAFGVTVIFAHIKIFELVSNGLEKIFLYKPSPLWRIIIFTIIIAGLVFYLKLSIYFAKQIKAKKEKMVQKWHEEFAKSVNENIKK